MPVNKHSSFKIFSEIRNIKEVEIFIRNFLAECCISEKRFNRIFLCVSEAVINSIIHGNKNDPLKQVIIKISLKENELIIKIKDEGDGFNFLLLEDPTKSENIRKEDGRGLFIIKSFTDSIQFKKKGCIIKFKFDIGKDVIHLL